MAEKIPLGLEIDPATGILKKKGWKVIGRSEFKDLGFETVAAKLAEAEGIPLGQARAKLKKAEKDKGI